MSKSQTKYITDEKGKKTAVVIPIEEYEELIDDLHNLAIIAERINEDTISMDDLKKKVRHIYDLHQLLKQKEYSEFIDKDDFVKELIAF